MHFEIAGASMTQATTVGMGVGGTRMSDRVAAATVLVVDDDPAVRRALVRELSSEGYRCLQAESKATAFAAFVSANVSLVLLDLGLGDDDGMDVLDDILKLHPDVAVIMVTGGGDMSTARHSLQHGAVGYMRKPIDQFELRTQVYAALLQQTVTRQARTDSTEAQRLIRRQVPCQLAERLATASRLRDAETGAHVARIGRFSTVLALTLGHSAEEADLIGVAATTHDVGKIAIPDSILLKPGRLTVVEFETMKQHTLIGAKILSGTDLPVLNLAERIALSHHERWDGTGYPHGLRGEECPIEPRIVAIVDVYDALIHARVYKAAWEESRVVALLEEQRGKQFEAQIVDAFLESLPAIRQVCLDLPEELV